MRYLSLVPAAAIILASSIAVAQTAAPAYQGGVGSPRSAAASNITPPHNGSEIAPRLPNPDAASDSPEAMLNAARIALSRHQTGAAQEALERAETRILSRTVDPARADQPARSAMARHIAEARSALGAKDIPAAKTAIDLALASPIPPRGPAVTVRPGG